MNEYSWSHCGKSLIGVLNSAIFSSINTIVRPLVVEI